MREVANRSARTDGISLRQLADALGVPLDDVTVTAIPALARKRVRIGVTDLARLQRPHRRERRARGV